MVFNALGAAMALGPQILYAFEQLGILQDLQGFSLDLKTIVVKNEKLEKLATVQMKGEKEIGGYATQLFARRDLYSLLMRQIPAEKISMSKKVLKIEDGGDKVTIHCADGSSYTGDILVGADGAYSTVRKNMYSVMTEKGTLPKTDLDDLVPGFIGMVGITKPMDPEKYPQVKELDHCQFEVGVGSSSHGSAVWCLPTKQIAWSLSKQFVSVAEGKKHMFENAEWNPEINMMILEEFRDLPCPYGGTIGDLTDATPAEEISKIYLEHKMFKTWFYGRSILLGDACHKMLPAGGQGALNALEDAVILANSLYDLEDSSQRSITTTFQSYYDQRYHQANAQYENSLIAAKVLSGATWTDRLIRGIVFNYLPDFIQQWRFEQMVAYRPLITFLPKVEFRGTGKVLPQ
ncbi:hypothetical protein BGZ83_011767, partial [Gryganskiella cystojenkinii]